jgi:hypothetical protein
MLINKPKSDHNEYGKPVDTGTTILSTDLIEANPIKRYLEAKKRLKIGADNGREYSEV